jgi:hypothetical protein
MTKGKGSQITEGHNLGQYSQIKHQQKNIKILHQCEKQAKRRKRDPENFNDWQWLAECSVNTLIKRSIHFLEVLSIAAIRGVLPFTILLY